MSYRSFLLLLLAFSMLVRSIQADTVYLRNGQQVEGEIVKQDAERVFVRTPNGTVPIRKDETLRISYDSAAKKKRAEEALRRQDDTRRSELVTKPKQEADQPKREAVQSPTGALSGKDRLWRSALIPGWGLSADGHPLAGKIYLATSVALLATTLYERKVVLSGRNDYNHDITEIWVAYATTSAFADPRISGPLAIQADADHNRAYNMKVATYWRAIGLLGAVYLAQLIHSFADATPSKTALVEPVNDTPRPFFSLAPEMSDGRQMGTSLQAGLSWIY